jgi:L-serine deaminase
MTRKNYILIADAIVDAMDDVIKRKYSSDTAVAITAQRIAEALQRDNPAFDSRRFFAYIVSQANKI